MHHLSFLATDMVLVVENLYHGEQRSVYLAYSNTKADNSTTKLEARLSAFMVLSLYSHNIVPSAPKGLISSQTLTKLSSYHWKCYSKFFFSTCQIISNETIDSAPSSFQSHPSHVFKEINVSHIILSQVNAWPNSTGKWAIEFSACLKMWCLIQFFIGCVIKTELLVSTWNTATGTIRKWPTQVGTVVCERWQGTVIIENGD